VPLTYKDAIFDPEAVKAVELFYKIHNSPTQAQIFSALIEAPYDFGVEYNNQQCFLKTPLDRLISEFNLLLGRCSWAVIDGCDVLEVAPATGLYSFRRIPLEVYADAFVEINGYPVTPDRFHILVARTKRHSLLNYKKFRILVLQILKRYKTITATSATKADHVIGMGDSSDWRFETHNDSNRLRVYWTKIGFRPVGNHKHQMYISNSKDFYL
jgi:hypothetical protein